MQVTREHSPGVRPEIVAIPVLVVLTFALRAKSLTVGVGGDEYSLLAMAAAILDGGFPYEDFWDVRPPFAYFWGLPSAYVEDAVTAVKTLRLLAVLAQAIAAWVFFCLFRRELGSLPASIGVVALLASVNMAELHHLAVPNHFAMVMSLGAFACAVEGNRSNLKTMYLASAALAGLLPWMMVHSAPTSLAIAALAVSGARSRVGWIRSWLVVAALPSMVVVVAYALWGPFDTFVRTVLLAPVDFLAEGVARGSLSLPDRETGGAGISLQMLHYVFLILAGLVLLPASLRGASPGSPLRSGLYLVLPPVLPLVLMAYIKSEAPEYWIDAAPAAALLVAVAVHRMFSLRSWARLAGFRFMRPSVLRGCISIYIVLVLVLLTVPEKEPSKPSLPAAYCEAASWWIGQLDRERTVLDTSALCSYWMLESDASLHPPFTFVDHWFRQLDMRWIGKALAGDGSESAAAERLRAAIGPASTAGIILADGRIFDEVRDRHWRVPFYRDWTLVWFRSIEGYDREERFSTLAIFVRRDAFPNAGPQWP